MNDDRLPTHVWVDAHIRKCSSQNIPIYILNKGADMSGTVMVKIVCGMNECFLYTQMRNIDGEMGWMDVFEGTRTAESEADAYIKRNIDRDPDVWVIEVEDKEGKNPFDGKIF